MEKHLELVSAVVYMEDLISKPCAPQEGTESRDGVGEVDQNLHRAIRCFFDRNVEWCIEIRYRVTSTSGSLVQNSGVIYRL